MARTDWKYDDVVTEKDLNQIGQEINEKETAIGSQAKADTAENNAKAYTDQQITLVTETGIPKLNVYEYKFNDVAIGTAEIEIPLETFDKQTDTVKVYINTVQRDTDYFTVGTNKIILKSPLTVESKVTIEVWKNIPIGEEGSVSGQVIAIDSLPKDRVQGLVDLESEFNSHKADHEKHFTIAEKNKLSGIQAGAQVNTITSVAGKAGAVTLTKVDVGLANISNYPIATQAQAEAGTVDTAYVTPLKVAQYMQSKSTKVARGTYTGNDATNRAIEVGFMPMVFYIIKKDPNHTLFTTFRSNYTFLLGIYNTTNSSSGVIMTTTGVTLNNVGNYIKPNEAGTSYEWLAIG